MDIIDACGRACPEPVLMTKKAVASKQATYEVLVDNATAAGNVTRFASQAGYTVTQRAQGEIITLTLVRK